MSDHQKPPLAPAKAAFAEQRDIDFSALRDTGRRVLREEADALNHLAERVGEDFVRAVRALEGCRGRVVVSGMGKSGSVARKIVGTLASTGTPALFLHPAEALHGDLGMVVENDVVLALSYSGETDELLAILPALRRRGSALIALTGSARSTLAQAADIVLDVSVEREACSLNLAPTTSTTAMIALGDALAIAVMALRGFGEGDYARLHPAGSLGRRLLVRASDIMRKNDGLAIVNETEPLRDALFAITRAHVGAACIVSGDGRLCGILTDGDVRRALLRDENALRHPAREAMTPAPRVVRDDPLVYEIVKLFESEHGRIGDLPVLDEHERPIGLLMLRDLLRAGIV